MVRLKNVAAPVPFEAFVFPVSEFPMPESEIPPLRQFLESFVRDFTRQRQFSTEVFIQATQLIPPEMGGKSATLLSQYGREWIPKTGLGVWPDRPAPTLWTKEEMMDLAPGERPRRLMHQVFRITKSPQARRNSVDVMLGFGTILEILTPEDGGAFLARVREPLLRPITQSTFTSFPFYVPLVDSKTLTRSATELEIWLGGVSLYIRESPEDHGVLFVSPEPISPVLQELGCTLESGSQPETGGPARPTE